MLAIQWPGTQSDSRSKYVRSNREESIGLPQGKRGGGTSKVIEEWNEGTEWYRVWSSGLIEQGGKIVQTVRGGAKVAVTLHKTYSNTNYSIFVTGQTAGDVWGYSSVSHIDYTTSSFTYMSAGNASSDGTKGTFWHTRGY